MTSVAKAKKGIMGRGLHSFLAMLLLLCIMLPATAEAQQQPKRYAMPEGTCTNQTQFDPPNLTLVQTIYTRLDSSLGDVSQEVFDSVSSGGETGTLVRVTTAMATLYIIIYGILFMFGAVSMTLFDVVSRMVKVAIVMLMANHAQEFYDMLKEFFDTGTEELLNCVVSVMYTDNGNCQTPAGASLPLDVVDRLISASISPKMVVTLAAIATTGFYGPMVFLLLVTSLKSIAEAIMTAVWVLIMAKIVRALLIGVAPLFVPFILFNRTREMFQGWLNQLVNACLQPIFVFAFFTFFVKMLDGMTGQILANNVCWTQMVNSGVGAPINVFWWRFTVNNQMFTGDWGPNGPEGAGGPVFPVNIFTVFLFFILAELVGRFSGVAISLANSISSASTNFSVISGLFSNFEGGPSLSSGPKSAAQTAAADANKAVKTAATTVATRPTTAGNLGPPPDGKGVSGKPGTSKQQTEKPAPGSQAQQLAEKISQLPTVRR